MRQEEWTVEAADAYLNEIPKFTSEKHTAEGLRRMLSYLNALPQEERIVHVAGTNGKGSVCSFLDAVLQKAGKRTARFTSPHLVRVTERFSFDGQEADDALFLEAFEAVKASYVHFEQEGLGHPTYFEYSSIWMDEIVHKGGRVTQLVNTNRLIRFYEGADGVKTGSTNEAKYCVSATAKRGDERFLAVVLGAPTGAKRFDLAGKLLNYAFENYSTKIFLVKGQVIDKQIPVSGALSRSISASALCDLSVLVKRGEEKNWTMEFNLPKCVRAPQRKGEVIGQAIALYCGERVTDVPIVLCEEIPKLGIPAIIREIFFRWL